MRALRIHERGGPEGLSYEEAPVPEPVLERRRLGRLGREGERLGPVGLLVVRRRGEELELEAELRLEVVPFLAHAFIVRQAWLARTRC